MRQANERALPMAPTVSIVTPTYNRAHLLPRAWASIARQTETRLEWIVVDDGSTDNTRQVVLAFNDPRIHYIYQHNQGENEARNRGGLEVRGDYVVYLDSDDEVLNETTLAEMLSEIRATRPEIAWVAFTVVDQEGRTDLSHVSANRIEANYIDTVCGNVFRGDFFRIYKKDVVQMAPWPPYRGLEGLRHWRLARQRPGLVVNRPAYIYYRDVDDQLTGAASAIRRAGDMAAAIGELIVDHKVAWEQHCPCQLGKYHFYRAMYPALSGSSARAVPDLLVAFRYGSARIVAKCLLLLGALVVPMKIRRWLFVARSRL